jgi:hypothetical protein
MQDPIEFRSANPHIGQVLQRANELVGEERLGDSQENGSAKELKEMDDGGSNGNVVGLEYSLRCHVRHGKRQSRAETLQDLIRDPAWSYSFSALKDRGKI